MLLVDDDQAEAGDRGEDGRARADADPRLAAGAAAATRRGARPAPSRECRTATRSPKRDAKARQRLRRHPDLGHEHDHPAPALERRLGGGEVDLGLARAGDPVQQQLAPPPRSSAGDDPLDRGALGRVELDRRAGGADRGASAGAGRTSRSAELDQAAALEPAQRVAPDPLPRRARRRRARPRAAAEQLERPPLARAEAARGRAPRRAAGGRARPRARSGRGSGRAPRPCPAAAPARARGPGSSSTRARPRARARPAPGGAPASSAAIGSARRSGGSALRSASSTTTPSSRWRPNGTRSTRADPDLAEPLGQQVVERPAQRAGGRQRLDLGDRHRRQLGTRADPRPPDPRIDCGPWRPSCTPASRSSTRATPPGARSSTSTSRGSPRPR